MSEPLNIIGIKTKQGVFAAQRNDLNRSYPISNLDYLLVDGKKPKRTFHNDWSLLDGEPKKIERELPPLKTNYRYELIDKSMSSDKIPSTLPYDISYVDEDGYVEWKDEYRHLQSLYEERWDDVEQENEVIDFTYSEILSIDELKSPAKLGWDIYRSQWTHEGIRNVGTYDLIYRLIDQIAFPKIYYETHCPVRLPSKTFYEILRLYINQNINSEVAYVSSNYGFCFTVKKRIKHIKPEIKQVEVLNSKGKSYLRPRFVTRTYQYAGDYIVFEMTSDKDAYKGYPILPSIEADNIDQLKQKIDLILKEIIKEINSEVVLCSHCNGTGVRVPPASVNINNLINSIEEAKSNANNPESH